MNFDGVQVGEINSLKLDNPRKVVAMVMVDKSAPIRKDTVVGLEFQGLTGMAAISLIGGAPAAPPVPLDEDGIPILTADLSEIAIDPRHPAQRRQAARQQPDNDKGRAALVRNLHGLAERQRKSDRQLSGTKPTTRWGASTAPIARIDEAVPGLAHGEAGELLQKLMTIRELADSFKKRSAARMEEGRRTLLDISQTANRTERKINPQAAAPRPPGKPNQNRQ